MAEDLSDLFVLLERSDEQQFAVSSDAASPIAADDSLEAVYVTSLLLVEPKPVKPRKNRIEKVVGDDLKVEDRLQVLDAMLPPPPETSSHKSKSVEFSQNKEGLKSDYKCELCGSSFQHAEQYFGHLQTHSGEHVWECSSCPSGHSVFETLSKLRQHEKLKHSGPNPHPHQCTLCQASYERASQLESHHRRVHIEEKNNVCRLCNKGFYKRSDLRTHLRVHLGLQSRVCEVCGRSFSHVSNLIRHSRLHTGVKPYPCSTCGRRFTQLTALEEHRLTHQTDRPVFPCPAGLCSRDFSSRSIALRHARRLHPEAAVEQPFNDKIKQQRRYHCAVCGETFEKASLLHLHESEHQDYSCSSCNEVFSSISELKAHGCSGLANPWIEEVDGSNLVSQITEEINPELVGNLSDVRQDVPSTLESFFIGNVLVCVDNGTMKVESAEEFLSDGTLQLTPEGLVTLSPDDIEGDQIVITGQPVGDSNDVPESSEPDPTSLYLRSFEDSTSPLPLSPVNSPSLPLSPVNSPSLPLSPVNSPSLPLSPVNSPSLPLSPVNSPPLVINNEGKVLLPILRKKAMSSSTRTRPRGETCSECGKHFRKTSNLRQHMGIHFADKQLYRCHVCSHTFAWKSSLNKHLPRHFPELSASQKVVCEDCGKEYPTSAQAHEHIRRDHLLERSHACQLCSKAFYKKHDLATHMRVHTKEKPYMCGTCGKTFTHVSHVKRHELIHRGIKRYECDTCQARFRQSSGLKAHVRRHHTCSPTNDIIDELCAMVGDVT